MRTEIRVRDAVRNGGFTMSGPVVTLAGLIVVVALAFVLTWSRHSNDPSAEISELLLYCAAGIQPPVAAVVQEYRKEFGVTVEPLYGGTGELLTTIKAARRGDLFLAADTGYLDRAIEAGLVRETISLARLRPVIAVKKGNPKKIATLKSLVGGDVKLSLANPEGAAVGRLSRKVLTQAGIWDSVQPNIKVFKPTVNAVADDLRVGAVDAAIIWDTTASRYGDAFDVVRTPELDGAERQVAIGILTSCQRPAAAFRFARYLAASDRGLLAFKKESYRVVDGDKWASKPEFVVFSGGVNRVAIEDMVSAFGEREGVNVVTKYNGCGILVGEMKTGARPDAYFACDASFMDDVEDLFLDSVDISETDMVIVVPKGNPSKIAGLEDLTREGLKIGVANPEQSALGELTQRLLREIGLYDEVVKNVRVQVPTADLLVNQLRGGALDAAIVYEANTSQVTDSTDIVRINHPKAKAIQPIAIGAQSKMKALARRFVDAMRTAASKQKFESVGFRFRSDDSPENADE